MRLIDADRIQGQLATLIFYVAGMPEGECVECAHNLIDAQPTIDAVSVVHAHWTPYESETGEGSNTYKCSACGKIQMLIDGTPKENGWSYCPHCGGFMTKED